MSDSFRAELIDAIRPLRAFSRTLIRDETRAEDLVQETLVKAWEKQKSFQPGTNIRAWLFTILRNTYYSELRKRKREVEDVDGKMTADLSVKASQDGHMAVRDLRTALEIPQCRAARGADPGRRVGLLLRRGRRDLRRCGRYGEEPGQPGAPAAGRPAWRERCRG